MVFYQTLEPKKSSKGQNKSFWLFLLPKINKTQLRRRLSKKSFVGELRNKKNCVQP